MTGMASPHEEKYSRMHLDKVWYVSLERLQKFEESNHCPEYKKSKYVLIYICIQNVFTKNEEVYMPRSIFFLFFDLLEVREENLKSQYLSFAFEASRQKCASPPKPNWIKNNTTHYWNIKYSIGIALRNCKLRIRPMVVGGRLLPRAVLSGLFAARLPKQRSSQSGLLGHADRKRLLKRVPRRPKQRSSQSGLWLVTRPCGQ